MILYKCLFNFLLFEVQFSNALEDYTLKQLVNALHRLEESSVNIRGSPASSLASERKGFAHYEEVLQHAIGRGGSDDTDKQEDNH